MVHKYGYFILNYVYLGNIFLPYYSLVESHCRFFINDDNVKQIIIGHRRAKS